MSRRAFRGALIARASALVLLWSWCLGASGGVSEPESYMLHPGGFGPSLSADGVWVAFECESQQNRSLCLGNTETRVVEQLVTVPENHILNSVDISADGMVIAYWYRPGTAGTEEIWVYDRNTSTTELVSVNSNEEPGSGGIDDAGIVSEPGISADGRYVVFSSRYENLVADDTNGLEDVFVRDRLLGTTSRVSLTSTGAEADGPSGFWGNPPRISDDGTVVVFTSRAENLVPGDETDDFSWQDTFLVDLSTGDVQRMSEVPGSSVGGDSTSDCPSVAPDGSLASFVTGANNLHAGPTNTFVNYLLGHDPLTGEHTYINRPFDDDPVFDDAMSSCRPAAFNGNAGIVYFVGSAENYVTGVSNGLPDVYAYQDGQLSLMRPVINGVTYYGLNVSTDALGDTLAMYVLDETLAGPRGIVILDRGDITPPEPPQVSVAPNPVLVDEPVLLSVVATDVGTSDGDIAVIEYRVDGGSWESIPSPVDGGWDEPTEEAEVELAFATEGIRELCARATDEASNTGSPACVDLQVDGLPPSLRLRAIEVNQVIQNWRNEVPLYVGKDTVVRVFVERIDPTGPTTFRGLLHGSVGGQPLEGSPLSTDGLRFASVADDAAAFSYVSGGDDVDSWREDLGNSANFTLPASWVSGTEPVSLEFQLSSPLNQELECAEPDATPDCSVSVRFETIGRPQIEFYSVPYDRNEILDLAISSATGGSYTLSSSDRVSDPIAWNATAEVLEDAVEDVLNSRDGRVRVGCASGCGDNTPLDRRFRITILRGQNEELLMDDSDLAGSATINILQDGGPTIAPSDVHLREQVRRVSDVFPSLGVDFRLRSMNGYNRAPTLLKVNTRMEKIRSVDFTYGRLVDKAFAFLLEIGPSSTKSGMAWLDVSSTYAWFAEDPEDGGDRRSIGMHEAAHTFGRAHAVVFGQGHLGNVGICGSRYSDLAFPPTHPFVEETEIENESAIADEVRFTWPTIGPLSLTPDDEIWGFSPRAYANGPGFGHLVVVDPRLSAELMSYCDPPGDRQDLWVSSFSYEKLRQRLGGRGVETREARGTGFGDYLLVSGWINAETQEVELDPAIRISGLNPGNEPGELHVALLDGSGAEIASSDVALLVDGDHESLSFGIGPAHEAFVAAVEIPSGSVPAAIDISRDGVTIAQATASANPPTVTLTSPAGGSVVTGDIPISWEAEDIDGDALTTTVLYSVDLGTTWETLALELEGTSYSAPTTYLEGSPSAMVRVLVSDGFHTTEATSSNFEVESGRPLASIDVPVNGIALDPHSVLRLRGDAWDPEDGLLEGAQLAWRVEDNGVVSSPFAFGSAVDVAASQFAEGCQTLTLTATDSDGRSGSDSVELVIDPSLGEGVVFVNGFEAGDTTCR